MPEENFLESLQDSAETVKVDIGKNLIWTLRTLLNNAAVS